ncbi:hypothetical protein [Nocardia seriolae]|uniref:Uncharacterized protein n=1 Tax=Nocardia seriolae TaxID=37332 RepID=A0A0B8N125_9NOCA|nr:hypothetical protein [Nocardia seriolae]APB00897.1 hypothetical protein NS506_06866 [Nocardia seriolae]MTJ65441.1 hypothetical protein [Nocardia seriolae]MTJ70865.1 hypothetical protein [Nocardia seriolae]MTJ90324.1 hypothetical protein [Nocardia seriolae]MTK34287.1 hypothetical protein [Nocardia seriolae]
MRVRTIAAPAVLVTGFAIAGLATTGTASAATPFVIPQIGAAGVELSPGETQALANSPIPALVDRFAPGPAVSVGVQPDSQIPHDGTYVFADMPTIVGEAAAHPNGSVDILVDGEGVAVIQEW